MTAQPSSQAEREDVAREVLARVADDRAGVHIHPVHYIAKRIAATYGYQPSMSGDQRDRLNSRQRRDVQELAEELYAAMLAFSDREHATPRSMPEEVVEALRAYTDLRTALGFSPDLDRQQALTHAQNIREFIQDYPRSAAR